MWTLPEPAFYFPLRLGRYTVAPGLVPITTPFGNGTIDTNLIQLDRLFPPYRANKLACRTERFGKYVCQQEFSPRTQTAAAAFLASRLTTEYPELFLFEQVNGIKRLNCVLTQETLTFNNDWQLISPQESYNDAFDALCCQIQEDAAIVQRFPDAEERVVALHLCAPSHWAAEDKIGRSFVTVHGPVPHFERIAAVSDALSTGILQRGPFVRFAWSLDFEARLNQHPEPPPGTLTASAQRAGFSPKSSPLFLRVERQVLWGLPEVNAYIFTIRVYQYDVHLLCEDRARKTAFLSSLNSMSLETRRYKGLEDVFDAVIDALS